MTTRKGSRPALQYIVKLLTLMVTVSVVIVWALKGCVLVFFSRLKDSFDKWQRVLINRIVWVCIAAFVACVFTLSLSCLPFSNHWRLKPLPMIQCRSKPQDLITLSVLNVLTDAAVSIDEELHLIKQSCSRILHSFCLSRCLLSGI